MSLGARAFYKLVKGAKFGFNLRGIESCGLSSLRCFFTVCRVEAMAGNRHPFKLYFIYNILNLFLKLV